MMLHHLNEPRAAERVARAVVDNFRGGGPRTPDLGGSASTMEFAEALARRVATSPA
jgi:isocitrate/isopropylmalate dehydrogenase